MAKRSQRDNVLQYLKVRGPRGATLNDLRDLFGIATPHARIGELIGLGYNIKKKDRSVSRRGFATYERVYRIDKPYRLTGG